MSRGGICQAIYRYTKANNKYTKNFDKNKISSYLEYLDSKNQYGWTMCKKLPVRGFKWIEEDDISKSNEEFIKHYDENGDVGYFLEVDIECPKKSFDLHKDLAFLPKRKKKLRSRKTCL